MLNRLRDQHNISTVNSGCPTKVKVTMPPKRLPDRGVTMAGPSIVDLLPRRLVLVSMLAARVIKGARVHREVFDDGSEGE